MNLFQALMKPLSDRGIGSLPYASSVFGFLWHHLGPKGIRLVQVGGIEFYIDKSDQGAIPMSLRGCWEPTVSEVFKNAIKRGITVLDIGAHVGYYTLMAAPIVGMTGHIYAFEPVLKTFELLERNIDKYGYKNVTLLNKAVTDSDGTHRLYIDISHNIMNSTLSKWRYSTNHIEVPTISLDNYLPDTKVDVIKMDIEGSEALALKGMRKIIERSPNLKLFTEINDGLLKGMGSSLEKYLQELLVYFDINLIIDGGRRGMKGLVPYKNPAQVEELLSHIGGGIDLYCERK